MDSVVSFIKTAMDPDLSARPNAAQLLTHEFVALSPLEATTSGAGAGAGAGAVPDVMSEPLARVASGEVQDALFTSPKSPSSPTSPTSPTSPNSPNSPLGKRRQVLAGSESTAVHNDGSSDWSVLSGRSNLTQPAPMLTAGVEGPSSVGGGGEAAVAEQKEVLLESKSRLVMQPSSVGKTSVV